MARERRLHPSWCVLVALAFPLGALAQFRRGNELQVNTYTTGQQRRPSVATEADGDFVVVWESGQSYQGHDGSVTGVFARRFSSAGVPLASEFQVNTFTDQAQDFASVAASASGDFVVAWRSRQDTSDYAIFARRISSTGTPVGIEFQVNTYTTNAQRFPSVAADAEGDFVIVWHTFPNQDGSGYGVSAQRFSSGGAFVATEFQVNTYTPDYQRYPTVAASASGSFVVAWQSRHQDGSSYGVFAQLFSSGGAPLTGEFQVNSYTMGSQRYVSVAASASGDFVVAWESYPDQDGSGFGIFARRFSSAGAALATEFQVNAHTSVSQFFASVTAAPDGDFVVAWTSGPDQDGSANGVFARRFSSAGSPLATEFQVNTYSPQTQQSPSVAAGTDGDFVVAWSSYQDGSFDGVFAQRFAASRALDIDGNGFTQPLTDGLLVVRYLFDFTGTTLTASAVGGGCTRCDAAAIEPYIAGLGMILDIDGDTTPPAPLTDGLLVLRFLFGFTGSTLTTGATAQTCTRCDAAMVGPYLNALTK